MTKRYEPDLAYLNPFDDTERAVLKGLGYDDETINAIEDEKADMRQRWERRQRAFEQLRQERIRRPPIRRIAGCPAPVSFDALEQEMKRLISQASNVEA